jgi:diguanylate cyclase (GGDEF)-like protein/PAS domain S-box-containing protein
MALAFWGYAILSGLIVKKTEGLPDFIPTQDLFYDYIGVPVQLFRALCALGITVSLVFILRRFNNYAYDRAQATAQTLEALVFTRTQELESEIKQRQALQERLMLFKYVFDFAHEAFLITDADERILEVNPWFTHLTGYNADEVVGKRPALLKSGKHDVAFFQVMWQSINETGQWQGEIFDKRKNGHIYPKWLSIVAVPDDLGKIRHYVGLFSDITERKEKEAEHYRLATTDPLTGLVNRRAMEECLVQIMNNDSPMQRSLAMMLIDLDHFKKVNDTLGHLVGDKLLCTIAQRLKDQVRTSDLVVRLGGDEFVMVLSNIDTQDMARLIAEKLVTALAEVALIDGHRLQISASIGIAFYPTDATTPLKLLHKADVAAYHAKGSGRNTYCFYHPTMENSSH